MKLTRTTFFFGCLVGGLGAGALPLLINLFQSAAEAETKLLPFQGRLTDAAGNAVADGAKVVEFKMYDAPTGGNVKWAGEVHKLSVNGGLVNTMLGSKAGLGSVDFSSATFLQITVDANGDGSITAADPPLLPRQSVVPTIYAAVAGQMQYIIPASGGNAATVAAAGWDSVFDNGRPDSGKIPGSKIVSNSVTSAQITDGTVAPQDLSAATIASIVPPGTVLPYAGPTAPAGYLVCNGDAVSTSNVGLFNAIGYTYGGSGGTFNLPDLRGRVGMAPVD